MTTTEKFCLKWNDFQVNMTNAFHDLRGESDFSDVTLVCEEDHKIDAHRVILSACSPFFKSVLKKNKHPHPLIYMRGLKAKDLVAILDFIYQGEANIFQDDLEAFLSLAEELQLKGLTGSSNSSVVEDNTDVPKVMPRNIKKTETKKERKTFQPPELDNQVMIENVDQVNYIDNSIVQVDPGRTMVAVDSSIEDVKSKIYSLMEKFSNGQYNWKCTVCGKPGKDRANMARHIESHIEGVSYPCEKCGKSSRSANALSVHVSTYHS